MMTMTQDAALHIVRRLAALEPGRPRYAAELDQLRREAKELVQALQPYPEQTRDKR